MADEIKSSEQAPAENFDLKNENESLLVKVQNLEAKIADLEKENADLKSQPSNDDLQQEIAALEKENAALKNKPAAAQKETFKRNGSTYEILVAKTLIPGLGSRTAMEISMDEEAQDILIKSQSGVIREVK